MGDFKCEICGNENPEFFGFINGKPYCRMCVQFEGFEKVRPVFRASYENTQLNLPYNLTEGQKRISVLIKLLYYFVWLYDIFNVSLHRKSNILQHGE